MNKPGPFLVDQLLLGLDGALPKKTLFRSQYYEFTAVALIGAYVFEQAAVIGMATSAHARRICALVLAEPTDAAYERFRAQTVENEQGRTSHLSRWYSEHDIELDDEALDRLSPVPPMIHLLRSEYPEVYAPGAYTLVAELYKQRMRQRWTPEEAIGMWSQAAGGGMGLGLVFPERTKEMLEIWFDPDPERWQQAREDGVNLPPKPLADTFDSYVERALQITQPLIDSFYPELQDVFP